MYGLYGLHFAITNFGTDAILFTFRLNKRLFRGFPNIWDIVKNVINARIYIVRVREQACSDIDYGGAIDNHVMSLALFTQHQVHRLLLISSSK